MAKILTEKEAYLAMFSFLEDYYLRTKSDEIGSILSGMCLMNDGEPMDAAYWEEWEQSIQKALSGKVDAEVRLNKDNPPT
ncbi:MAG: hypothetical protein ABJJ43_00190 [Ekhidna sp.]